MIEGNPIDDEVSSLSRKGADSSEPIRCRVFETNDVGDLSSRTDSSRVRVLVRA